MSQPLENIIKQGYLKKGNSGGSRISALLRKFEGQKWFVFTIRQSIPYLEYYDNDTEVFTQRPINSYCLSKCHKVYTLTRSDPPSFTVACADRYFELIASSRAQVLEWVNDMETSLTRLGIIKEEKDDHIYTALPAVVRQPRVNQNAVEDREGMDAAQSLPSPAPHPSSSHQSDQRPPPIPERPPRISVRHRPPDPTSSPPIPTTDLDADLLGANLENGENIHCSNDSDFVSWDVVMRVRESYLQKSEEEQNACGEAGLNAGTRAATGSIPEDEGDIYGASSNLFEESLYVKPQPKHALVDLDDSLDLTVLPNSDSTFPDVGFGLDLSLDTGRARNESQIEENEYSLLPSGLMPKEQGRDGSDTELKEHIKPVPLPRRALSLKTNSLENHLTDGIGLNPFSLGATNASSSLFEGNETENEEDDYPFFSLSENLANAVYDNNSIEKNKIPNGTNMDDIDSKKSEIKDENANFYDDKNSTTSHCVLAPPTIPPRCDSLGGWTQTPTLSSLSGQDSTANSNAYSPSIPSSSSSSSSLGAQAFVSPSSPTASSVMSKPTLDLSSSSKDNNAFHSHPTHQLPTIPPLPVPRRLMTQSTLPQGAFHTTDSNGHAATDEPPKLPRRNLPKSYSVPQDTPPQLPSRNSKSVAVMRPKLASSFSFAASDEKAKLLDDEASIASAASIRDRDRKSATLGATAPEMRQSGLSKKMLLDRANSLHTVVSLKKTQAEILQAEIDKDHVSVTLTQKSGHGLALVDWNGMPCIAGWNQKDFPSLHGKLHIGDMLISVNNVRVSNPEMTQKLLRHATEPKIDVVLQRMPYAKVFAIRRSAEGQSLGLKREGGTAEILYVDPNGLAAEHGLPQYAQGALGKPRCTWFLTEINSRPLNLFFKENEIEHLLYAVGREISIVVQPSDFVLELRRGLKKLKNHKSFITQ